MSSIRFSVRSFVDRFAHSSGFHFYGKTCLFKEKKFFFTYLFKCELYKRILRMVFKNNSKLHINVTLELLRECLGAGAMLWSWL